MTSNDPANSDAGFTIVGHRGAMAQVLENTIASFRAAENAGCRELELDVRPSADGRIVISHDRTLDRVVAGDEGRGMGPVDELEWRVICRVELRDGHRVHTFEEVFEATTVFLQVEIKDPAVVPLLVDAARRLPTFAERVRLTSFDADALVQARDQLPQIPRGLILGRLPAEEVHPEGLESALQRTGAGALYCGWEGLTPELVEAQHAAGRQVHGWPTRSPEHMQRALALGLDGTTVDDPEAAFAWFERARAATA
ncbi:glycerophosphodiester phosphodiesterase [Brachybacterium sp. FME24]|uniref:glycerophosphodiester phosphodiesterase n=1 Tax=Brachybacterium sp. FME24 TaxID=2742605 RepID=UPI0018675D51|nr:glycerophosphodiester phosphodiesterase [Brachybacterium sp. FME24]